MATWCHRIILPIYGKLSPQPKDFAAKFVAGGIEYYARIEIVEFDNIMVPFAGATVEEKSECHYYGVVNLAQKYIEGYINRFDYAVVFSFPGIPHRSFSREADLTQSVSISASGYSRNSSLLYATRLNVYTGAKLSNVKYALSDKAKIDSIYFYDMNPGKLTETEEEYKKVNLVGMDTKYLEYLTFRSLPNLTTIHITKQEGDTNTPLPECPKLTKMIVSGSSKCHRGNSKIKHLEVRDLPCCTYFMNSLSSIIPVPYDAKLQYITADIVDSMYGAQLGKFTLNIK